MDAGRNRVLLVANTRVRPTVGETPALCESGYSARAATTLSVSFPRESLASPNSSDGDFYIRRLQPVAAGRPDGSRKRISKSECRSSPP